MKCPACDRRLTELEVGPVVLDACQRGCGGIWFDADELAKVNQTHPAGTEPLAEIIRNAATPPVDKAPLRSCVRCPGVKLERKLFSLGTGVIMDCCPQCSGVWLDHGELNKIREETHPTPRALRQVVSRRPPARRIPITFGVVQRVQNLAIKK